MPAFTRQFSPASPVLAISPQPPHRNPLAMAAFAHQHSSISSPSLRSTLHRPPLSIGRKRSRDEASLNLEPDAPTLSTHNSQEGWVYGEGMVLIKPGTGYVAEASSQSGTWLEEKSTIQEKARSQSTDYPELRSHKSQRMDLGNHHLPSKITTTGMPTNNVGEPVIDVFTLHLGIGWRRISNEDHIQAAARGWARFIENHYPLSNVHILVESKGLQSYLVETSEGFFLFTEDLRQARLVSRDTDGALQNLQRTPPNFDGVETLFSAESPRLNDVHIELLPADTDMNLD